MSGMDTVPPNLILTNGAMTGTSQLTSSVVTIQGFSRQVLQANFVGTAVGTFFVDVCEDYNANTGNAGTWTTLPVTLGAPAGSTDTSFMDIQTGAAYMRVRYLNDSGTGTLNVYYGAKTV